MKSWLSRRFRRVDRREPPSTANGKRAHSRRRCSRRFSRAWCPIDMTMFKRASIRGLCCSAAAILTCVGSVAPAYACDCSDPPLQWVRAHADVIFRGTLVALPPATGPQGFGDTFDTGKIAVFQVSRVWKGNARPTLEMPALLETSACWGFGSSHVRVGNDLLVFAFDCPARRAMRRFW